MKSKVQTWENRADLDVDEVDEIIRLFRDAGMAYIPQ